MAVYPLNIKRGFNTQLTSIILGLLSARFGNVTVS